jgi:plasmid stability protein
MEHAMATVTIRNLDDKVVTALKARARLHKRSLEAELRVLLRTATLPAGRRQNPDVPQSDSTDLRRDALGEIDQRLLARVMRQAELHGRSLEQELHAIVRNAVPYTPEERVALAETIAAMTPRKTQQTDSTLLIREDRDSR